MLKPLARRSIAARVAPSDGGEHGSGTTRSHLRGSGVPHGVPVATAPPRPARCHHAAAPPRGASLKALRDRRGRGSSRRAAATRSWRGRPLRRRRAHVDLLKRQTLRAPHGRARAAAGAAADAPAMQRLRARARGPATAVLVMRGSPPSATGGATTAVEVCASRPCGRIAAALAHLPLNWRDADARLPNARRPRAPSTSCAPARAVFERCSRPRSRASATRAAADAFCAPRARAARAWAWAPSQVTRARMRRPPLGRFGDAPALSTSSTGCRAAPRRQRRGGRRPPARDVGARDGCDRGRRAPRCSTTAAASSAAFAARGGPRAAAAPLAAGRTARASSFARAARARGARGGWFRPDARARSPRCSPMPRALSPPPPSTLDAARRRTAPPPPRRPPRPSPELRLRCVVGSDSTQRALARSGARRWRAATRRPRGARLLLALLVGPDDVLEIWLAGELRAARRLATRRLRRPAARGICRRGRRGGGRRRRARVARRR